MRSLLFLSLLLTQALAHATILLPGSIIDFKQEIVATHNPLSRASTLSYYGVGIQAQNRVIQCSLTADYIPAYTTWIISAGEYRVENTTANYVKKLIHINNPKRSMYLGCGTNINNLTIENIQMSLRGTEVRQRTNEY